MNTRTRLLALLADGQFHSGTEVGRKLGISRAAVCKGVHTLAAFGLDIHRVPGRGYKLASPVRPLEVDTMRRELERRGVFPSALEVLESSDSTNRHLLDQAAYLPSGAVCLAEVQTGGRGRRGRTWVATPYQNLALSIAWRFEPGPGFVAGFSLVAGLAVLEALEEYGIAGLGLKWPNDLVWQQQKLGGILADVRGEADGPSLVVLGVGINCRLASSDAQAIDQPWIDLETMIGVPVDRNRLGAIVIARLFAACRTFAVGGFGPYQSAWERRHVYHGRPVRLMVAEATVHGTVVGVEASGALRVRVPGGAERVFHAGEISLRASD